MFCHSCVAYKKFYEAKWTNIPYSKNKLYIWSVIFLSSFWISEYSYETWRQLENCNCQWHSQWSGGLESTDVAPEVPHLHPMGLPARRTASAFFFYFLGFASTRLDSRRCGSIRAESALIRAEPGWFGQNRAVSAISGRIGRRPKQVGKRLKQAETHRKRPKSALNMARKAETCILLSFFVNQGIVCVF